MALNVYADDCGVTSPKWSRAFAIGCGGRVVHGGPFDPSQPFAFWGSPKLWGYFIEALERVPAWYYGDKGFFGRGQYFRCARNAMQFDGASGDDDPRRFRRFNIPIKDWRASGSHILICPNSEVFFGLHGFARGEWIARTVEMLRRYTDRPLRVRWKADAVKRPLEHDLKGCWAVVTFVSNAAVFAALAGVPVFCTGPCAGLTMGSNDLTAIERPVFPQVREAWAARLANNQWTLDEMRRGLLWQSIGEQCRSN
jgi:hypothetical protein